MASYTPSQLYNGVDGPTMSSSTTYTFTVTNGASDISYLTLETYSNLDIKEVGGDSYNVLTPKNCEGTWVVNTALDIIYDDYKSSVVIPSNGCSFNFTPSNNVSSNTWRILGTGELNVNITP